MPPDPGPSMPRLVRLYIISALVGLGLSVLFVLLLMLLDVAGLRHLVLGSRVGWLAGLMLIIFNMIVFTGVQFGIAVMRLADSSPPSDGLRIFLNRLRPACQHACARKLPTLRFNLRQNSSTSC